MELSNDIPFPIKPFPSYPSESQGIYLFEHTSLAVSKPVCIFPILDLC